MPGRAAEFLHDAIFDQNLSKKLHDAQRTGKGWVDAGEEAGYEFTEDDLRNAVLEIAQQPLEDGSYVEQFVKILSPKTKKDVKGHPVFDYSPEVIARIKAYLKKKGKGIGVMCW